MLRRGELERHAPLGLGSETAEVLRAAHPWQDEPQHIAFGWCIERPAGATIVALYNHCVPSPSVLQESERDAVEAVLTASRALVAVAARSLASLADEVTLAQYRSLVVLASRGPQGLAPLAESLSVSPSTATRMCDRLVRKGLITRQVDEEDRRLVRLQLSASGRRLVEAVTRRRRAEIASVLAALSAEEQRAIAESLNRLAAAAGELPERDWTAGWDL